MQFVDLLRQFKQIRADVRANIDAVLAQGRFIMGPEVGELERRLSKYTGARQVLACSSGTDALVIALMALGVTNKDAVFVPSFTFFATAEAVSLAGATLVFVDSDPNTMNIWSKALERAIIKMKSEGALNPRGVIPVDLFGLPVDYMRIREIAQNCDLFILEDAAQSFKSRGIPMMIYYPVPVHLSDAYSYLGYAKGDLPMCEALSGTVLSIPIHPYLTPEETELICRTVLEASGG